jgi:hypothetical protein
MSLLGAKRTVTSEQEFLLASKLAGDPARELRWIV